MGVKSNKKLKSVNLGDSLGQELPIPEVNPQKGKRNCIKSHHYQSGMNNFQMLQAPFLQRCSISQLSYKWQLKTAITSLCKLYDAVNSSCAQNSCRQNNFDFRSFFN